MDVTSSVEVGFQAKIGNPYLTEIKATEINRMLKDIMSTGRYAGGTITISAGVVTIPVGTVFYIGSIDQVVRVEVKKAITVTATATLDSVFMSLVVGVTGIITVVLDVAANFPAGDIVKIGTTSGGPPPDTITLQSTLDKASPKKIYLPLRIPNLVAADSFFLSMPVAGLVTGIQAVNDTATATDDATITPKIATVSITGGLLTFSDPAAAGTVVSATPTALNVVTKGDAIEFVVGGANSGVGGATILVEITQ